MILVRLLGGLGNQMFQYAAGLALAGRLDTELRLDISWFADSAVRRYSLDALAISARPATAPELLRFGVSRPGLVARGLSALGLRRLVGIRGHVKEPAFQYWPGFRGLGDGSYLDGYWQSERYFEDIGDTIRREFTVREAPDPENRRALDAIRACEAVALHVRRGDYATSPDTNRVHGTTPVEYYHAAGQRIRALTADPVFFVFSDDHVWARENLRFDAPLVYLTHNAADRDVEDLRLMSACRHHIIANSTFSWWGAWLAQPEGQRVIAPRRWFNVGMDTRDLIPGRWERL